MDKIDDIVFAQVIDILDHTDIEIVNKIPKTFYDFLLSNKKEGVNSNINFDDENWKNSIEEDTKALMALIYRDYIVSKEEKEKLIEEEKQKIEENNQKYSAANIFNQNNNVNVNNNMNMNTNVNVNNSVQNNIVQNPEIKQEVNNTQLIEVKESKWYQKIWDKIISIFGKKNK